jgi:hypothetical protein
MCIKPTPLQELEDIYEKEAQLKNAIVFAREYIKETKVRVASMYVLSMY